MTQAEAAFPTRVLRFDGLEGTQDAPDPARINQHIEGLPDGKRVMEADEISRLLNDPFATLVLRANIFPKNLTEILEALDSHNDAADGLPEQSSFLIAEGGQITFAPALNKGGSRLITVRARNAAAELIVSTLVPPGVSPRTDELLNEVQSWDPVNRTMHFYQRQQGTWFWCGQSDMALEAPTRGEGAFDSHVNGYVVMKELKTPWVHWHGPGLGIAETAYAADDPLVTDSLFRDKDTALTFETRVVRPLMARWNTARFEKHLQGNTLARVPEFVRQVLDATSANLISTHTEWRRVPADDLGDIPATFFVDLDGLTQAAGLTIDVPPLRLSGARYQELAATHDLRVRDGAVDLAGDVPFCFTVPERAFEDTLVATILVQRGVISARLTACLLMVDFTNPVGSPQRAALLSHIPETVGTDATTNLDSVVPNRILAAATSGSPEAEFATLWNLGPDAWQEAFADRIEAFLSAVAASLATDEGSDAIFRLAESRRREFRARPLAEFGLTLPQAVNIPEGTPPLDLSADATVAPRA